MVRMKYVALAAPVAGFLAVAAQAEYSAKERPDVQSMSTKEIRLHNAALETDDPHYIKCRRSAVTGSLARKVKLCLTNLEWQEQASKSQEWTAEVIDKNRSLPCGGPDCPS